MAPRQRLSAEDDTASSPPTSQRQVKLTESSSSVDSSGVCDLARERHDWFNLAALLPLVFLTIINFDIGLLMREVNPEAAWTGEYFIEYWSATVSYFLVDLIWVARVPSCVKSPGTIIKHHCIVVFYLLGPLLFPDYAWFMGACLLVEINTWFLIARRLAYKKNAPPEIRDTIAVLFYTSWIAIRCGVYPMVLFNMLSLWHEAIQETGNWMYWEVSFIPVHFCLCVLNLKWTWDLFTPIFNKWRNADGRKVTVANGL